MKVFSVGDRVYFNNDEGQEWYGTITSLYLDPFVNGTKPMGLVQLDPFFYDPRGDDGICEEPLAHLTPTDVPVIDSDERAKDAGLI